MSAISATRSSAAGPSLPRFGNAEDVHVVAFDLDAEPASVLLLSADERLRAERFHFERDRRRFVAARSVLRRSLARYLGADPAELVFEYGAHGKPSLPGSGVTFNVSHSGRAALVAFAPGFDVGVDLELLAHGRPDDHRVADRFFSPYEVSTLASYPAAERSGAFLRCWTRKEAFVKAHGDGLSLSLQDFDVAFGAGEACGLLRTAWSSVEPAEWTLLDISELAVEGVAALAARTPGARAVRMPRNALLERKGART